MAAIPYTPGGGGLEADIMETLAFFNSDSIEQDHLLQSSTCVPPIPSSSFTIPFVEDNGCAAAPPCRSRSSRIESLRNGKLFVDIDSHYTDSEDECAGVGRLHSRRSNTSSKRDRATHVHNLSEKRRRDRINEKMKELQLLVPNSKKTDKASMLDEAIDYVKQLQLQVQILSSPNKMNQSHSCVAMGIPCFQMPQMCMNMNMGFMGMGINTVHSHSQWNNGCMTVPQGVQGQPILPWSNEQNKEYFNAANQPMFKKVSEHNNLCEAGSGNTSRPRYLQATHSQ